MIAVARQTRPRAIRAQKRLLRQVFGLGDPDHHAAQIPMDLGVMLRHHCLEPRISRCVLTLGHRL
jgi:hypothetical protein